MTSQTEPYNQLCAVHIGTTGSSGAKIEGTGSGILIDPRLGFVLTHASLIYPLHKQFHHSFLRNLRIHGSSMINSRIFNTKVSVDVILPNLMSSVEGTELSDERNIQPVTLGNSLLTGSLFKRYKGHVKMVFESRNLRRVINKLMPKDRWTFEIENENLVNDEDNFDSPTNKCTGVTKKNEELYYFLLPCFVLIQLKDHKGIPTKSSLMYRDALHNFVGDPVEICATPFGSMSPDVFLNSRSRGIISKVAGQDKVLLMTDARCVPGCEGGGLFYVHKGQR